MVAPSASSTLTRKSVVTMLLLGLSLVCVGAGQSMVFVVVPLAARDLGFSPSQIGMIFAFSAFFWLITSQFWGEKSDTWGRRPVFIIGMLGYAASLLLFVLALSLGAALGIEVLLLLAMLSCARSLNGIFGSASRPAAMAYVADVTHISVRVSAMARVESGFTIGTLIGPVLGAFLLVYGTQVPFIVFAVCALVCTVLSWFALSGGPPKASSGFGSTASPAATMDSRSHAKQKRKSLGFTDPRVRSPLLVAAAQGVVHASLVQTLGLFFVDAVGTTVGLVVAIGIAFTIQSIGGVLSQWLIVEKFKHVPHNLARFSALFSFVAWVGMSLANSDTVVYTCMVLHGMSFGVLRAANSSIMSLSVSRSVQGRAQGILGSVAPVGHILTPVITMPLYALDPHYPYILSAVAMAGVTLLILTSRNFRPRRLTTDR